MSGDVPGWTLLGRDDDGRVVIVDLTSDGASELGGRHSFDDVHAAVAARPATRWIWSDTSAWYPPLLAAGVTIERCRDLRLCHLILREAQSLADAGALARAESWSMPAHSSFALATGSSATSAETLSLFDLDVTPRGVPDTVDEALAELARQHRAVASATDPRRLELLLAAESAGALIAEEMRSAGLPWDVAEHNRLLTGLLGERTGSGRKPTLVEAAAARVREALGDPSASLDSQPKLLRSLHRVGVLVESTSQWELAEQEHPVIAPLLEYKKLSRLHSANGWAWLDEWVSDGRFRPVFVPGGVVTGRWASSGGGALQIPRQLRPVVRADPGWKLVVADVAQLEPRVLAAMASDMAMADAARGRDLYEGIVDGGAVETRADAKIAVLGAMYGATSGDSGRLVPRLRRAYPRAMGLVDAAAQTGEQGGLVATWLGRTSPGPGESWRQTQADASGPDASASEENRARRWARDRGRFTRNFIVQGSAAEWALCWIAATRRRLAELPAVADVDAAHASGPAFARRAHLAFFLHDEIIVHTPAEHADAVADAIRAAAAEAATLLFGGFPIDFPLDLKISASAAKD